MKQTIYGVLEGMEGLVLSAKCLSEKRSLLWLVEDEVKAVRALASLAFFAPTQKIFHLPAFDCLPYDSFSPSAYVAALRAATLAQIGQVESGAGAPIILLASLSSAMQKVPPQESFTVQKIKEGDKISFKVIEKILWEGGYERTDLVAQEGEYALRGGLLDVFPPNSPHPVRIDFFGDEVKALRLFDKGTQRTLEKIMRLSLLPASELLLNDTTKKQFQKNYVDAFGFASAKDKLYQGLLAQEKMKGVESYLPLFYSKMVGIFDYLPNAIVAFNENILSLTEDREVLINTCFESRVENKEKALPAEDFYFTQASFAAQLDKRDVFALSPFDSEALGETGENQNHFATKPHNFSEARVASNQKITDAVQDFIAESKKPVWFAAANESQEERMRGILPQQKLTPAATFAAAIQLPPKEIALVPLDLDSGIETPDRIILCEEDILGKKTQARRRLRRRTAAERCSELMLAEALRPDDIITHRAHGIGRFQGLRRIEVNKQQHDCLLIIYAGGDKLYIPVENADLISRYGHGSVALDKLGSRSWQTRKERVERNLWEMAGDLISVEAARKTAKRQPLAPPEGIYHEFCQGFGFEETPDQLQAIDDVLEDLSSGQVMDRLICGDVGFGKTEIALRAAFIQAMSGKQVAIVVPTTLLCRQHYENFRTRFAPFPLRVGQLSRLVNAKERTRVKEELSKGTIDIVIGTHALLSKTLAFDNLGLIIIDEEQHFGVRHKEQLKELRSDLHILTLTATPIPRTLQLALSGAREISLIGDPPAGRLAVHNFIGAFDPLSVSQALLREKKRDGQSFFICPHISNLEKAESFLQHRTPELRVALAHGKLTPHQLEEQVGIFYDGAADVLLSTPIVEAGLDVPTANTLVVWNAHQFGLAQLHQLRGRVGRAQKRAYAYFTLPKEQLLTRKAEERLLALQSTQFLGAGFSLAARDLDSRGAGNLLGKDQSGHVKEIGYELYQKMLAEAVAQRRTSPQAKSLESFSPFIRLPIGIMIPETYIPDMSVRLALYRRTASLGSDESLTELQEEIQDRFGPMPTQLGALFWALRLKVSCRLAGIEQLDIGERMGVRFYQNKFENPSGLVRFIEGLGAKARILPDHRLLLELGSAGSGEISIDDKLQKALNITKELRAIKDEAENIRNENERTTERR